jgi:hypothetical protein
MAESRIKQLRDLLKDAIENDDQDQIDIIKAELQNINPNYKKGGAVTRKAGRLAKRGYGIARR